MKTLFGRSSADPFFDEALKYLENSSTPIHNNVTVAEQRALARNLRHDSRVSENRQQKFEQFVADSRTASSEPVEMARTLIQSLKDYNHQFVKFASNPEFVEDDLNSENIQSAHRLLSDTATRFNLQLVRTMNLSGLTSIYQWAQGKASWKSIDGIRFGSCGTKAFDPSGGNPTEWVTSWLSDELDGKSKDEQSVFVQELCRLLKRYREEVQIYHPYWTAFWHEFSEFASAGPDTWSQLLGINSDPMVPQWILLLVYPPDTSATYARPTQLDAGLNAQHYPSPNCFAGGHPMKLRSNGTVDRLLTELIHTQIDHVVDHFVAGDMAVHRTSVTTLLDSVENDRNNHYAILCKTYPDHVDDLCRP